MQFYCLSIAVLVLLAIGSSSAKTDCEIQREKQEKNVKAGGLAILVPKCNADGSYASLQCHHNSNFCQCWDKDGTPQSAPKINLAKCNCLLDRSKQLKSMRPSDIGHHEMTSCEKDGSFTPRQCNSSACWCVNPDSGAKLGNENKNKSAVKC